MDTHANRQRRKALHEALAAGRGVTIPGTGVWRWHRRSGGRRNASGVLYSGNEEWSRTGRKWEDRDRNLNNKARFQNIAEQLDELADDFDPDDWYLDELDNNLLYDALEDLPTGVTFNGNDYSYDPNEDWYDDEDE